MKKLTLITIIFFCLQSIFAQEIYSKLKIHLENHQVSDLIQLGIDADHGIYAEGKFFTSDFSASDRVILDRENIPYEILVDDVVAQFYYDNAHPNSEPKAGEKSITCFNNTPLPVVPNHWHLGTMGGYFTYTEMLQMLDSMAAEYPTLISARAPLSNTLTTYEGRTVYMVKVSDNVNLSEAAEPKLLYTALHHAREPLSLSQMIMYLYYVLENYNTNPRVKNIVDNSEMYFVPCLNPDGYLYNQSTNPGGGGMWRKNRRLNSDGTFGVDLNRNYGYLWAYDNIGSSPTRSSDTYRGTSAFSEPETRMIRDFVASMRCEIVLNYHTYGNDVVYPWGFINQSTPDSAIFKRYAAYMTKENNYKYGTGFETVGYNTNGDSDDFGYGDSVTKNQYFSMTPECGDAFWMPSTQITATCQNLILQNIKTAELVIDAAILVDKSPVITTLTNGFFSCEVERLGLNNTDTFKLECFSLTSGLTVSNTPKYFINMNLLEKKIDSVSYSLDTSILVGNSFSYYWKLTAKGFSIYDTINHNYEDSLEVLYTTDASSISGWTNSGSRNWGISTTQFISAPSSIHDSPTGSYSNNASYILTNNTIINLTNANAAYLTFYCKWNIEDNYDYAEVMALDVATNIATPLCGRYTVAGSTNQDVGNPLYDGVQNTWVHENIDLSDYLGKQIKIRLRLVTDAGSTADGFYFDDMEVLTAYVDSTADTTVDTTNTGIRNIIINTIQVYPTYTQDEVMIIANSQQSIQSYQLVDQLGNVVVNKQNLNSDKQAIDIRNYSKGIYYLKVIDRYNQLQTFKLMKY